MSGGADINTDTDADADADDVHHDEPLTSYPLLQDALVFNVKGNTAFKEGFSDPRHWIIREDSDTELDIPQLVSMPLSQSTTNMDTDTNITNTDTTIATITTQRVFLSRSQLPRSLHEDASAANTPPPTPRYHTLTAANPALGAGISGGEPKAASWANHRNGSARSWILPAYHPRQHRRQCVTAAIAAGLRPTRFYTPNPQQQPEYTLYLTNAIVNVNGIIGTLDGYVHFREGCEHQEKLGRNWHRPLIQDFKQQYPAAKTRQAKLQAWKDAFTVGEVPFTGYASGSGTGSPGRVPNQDTGSKGSKGSKGGKSPLPRSNVQPGRVLDSVFVMDAIWDFNFHHVLVDSVAKLVHWCVCGACWACSLSLCVSVCS